MCTKDRIYRNKIKGKFLFTKKLNDLGISSKYIGYFYLIDILDLLINEEKIVKSFSKQIYPIIAEKFNKTSCTIERNIRNLIDKNWNKSVQFELLGTEFDARPTCCEFIFLVKNYITDQIL